MFSKLVSRNSSRSRKENGLFFSSLFISVIAFYMVLSLPEQDVMVFLKRMESDAVNKLLGLLPVFYGATLFILFFLIYYASRFQMERRRHEFGVYLMMGMRRSKLFLMLLAEDLRNSVATLLAGVPAAVLLSELVSLVTARLVGIGLIGHHVSFSWKAVAWTVAGFTVIKLAAFLLHSGRISRQEIGSLLADAPEAAIRQLPASVYAFSAAAGVLCLAAAYRKAVREVTWDEIGQMGLTVAFGLAGTLLFFQGLRFLIGLRVKNNKKDAKLHMFNVRQIHETVIRRSGTMAICSLLILSALCCFGAGVAISRFYGESESHLLDYTFEDTNTGNDVSWIRQLLKDQQLDQQFSDLFEMKTGHMKNDTQTKKTFQMDSVMDALRELPPSKDRDVLLNNLSYADSPYLISLSCYNHLLEAAGQPGLQLDGKEAAVYIDSTFTTPGRTQILNQILKTEPQALLLGKKHQLTGAIQSANLVTDRSITLSFALIVPDDVFERYTRGTYNVYLNGILAQNKETQSSLMSAISQMNEQLDQTGLTYESYLQNMGRQLFYMVAASYLTIYLAIIFLIIANTVIGVQFLMGQRRSRRRYRTLIHLGASYQILCQSAQKQILWYFGIPVAVAACSSLFGVRALFTGILSSATKRELPEMIVISAIMITVLCIVECIYMLAVKRSSDKYLLTLMMPEREE
ncbi:MAG: FtsX-like permease family protein [Eubacterium sp.]|nr:FtsX-like permease family protein [Eubacterium sp.]